MGVKVRIKGVKYMGSERASVEVRIEGSRRKT